MADSNVHPHLRLDVDLAGQDMDIDHLVIDTGIDNVDLNLEDRGIDNVGLNLEDRIDNVGLNLADLEQFILNDNSNKIFYDILPESPPDSGSEHFRSPQHEVGSPVSSIQTTDARACGGQDTILFNKDPFMNSQLQFINETTKISRDLEQVDYSRPLQLLEQGSVLQGQTNSLPRSRTGNRINIPPRASNRFQASPPSSFIAKPSQENPLTSLLNPHNLPSVVILDNKPQQNEIYSGNDVKIEPVPSPKSVDVGLAAPTRKRSRLTMAGGKDTAPQPPAPVVKSEGEGAPMEGELVTFYPFQPQRWVNTANNEFKVLSTPVLSVSADKGFNYSIADESFIVQKKNHFQLTCHVTKEGNHSLVSGPGGSTAIQYIQLSLYGVKKEAPHQTIQIEQSQTDRSKKKFFPIKLSFRGDQTMRVSVGRLHFSETTLNNMRKRGKPNPDQRYFQLVVSLEAVLVDRKTVTLAALATEKIIVRASNPGLFEVEPLEGVWNKGQTDTLYHIGKVGIGTDVSAETLTVQGNLQLAGQILHPSDRRIKQDISVIDPKIQLKNVQNIQVVKYKYSSEYLDNFPEGEREKMQSYHTGVLAQSLAEVLPDAVQTAGDLDLKSGGTIPNMLIVNKDRLFLENIGAVRELSAMTTTLGTRVDQLETSVKMSDMKRYSTAKSSASLTSSSSSLSRHHRVYQFMSRPVQAVIVVLVAIMTLSLLAMACVYIAGYVRDQDAPLTASQVTKYYLSNQTTHPSVLPSLQPGPGNLTSTVRAYTARTTTKPKLSQHPTPIGQPIYCNSEGCESFCVNADMYGQQESITAAESRTAAQSRTAAESRAAAESRTAAESRAAADSGTNNFVEGISAISTDLDAENEISPQDASRSLTNEVNMSSRNEILTNSNESENAIHSDPTTEDRTMSLQNDHESDEQTSDNNDQSENPALSLANSFVPSPRNEFSSISVIQRNVIPDSLSAEIQRNAEEIFQEPNQNEDKGPGRVNSVRSLEQKKKATFTDSKTESKLANDDDILEADVSAKLQQQTIDRELAELAELAENEEENEIADVSEDYSQSRDESIASQKNGTERDGQSKAGKEEVDEVETTETKLDHNQASKEEFGTFDDREPTARVLISLSDSGDEEVETENDVTSHKDVKLTNKDKGSLVDWKVIVKSDERLLKENKTHKNANQIPVLDKKMANTSSSNETDYAGLDDAKDEDNDDLLFEDPHPTLTLDTSNQTQLEDHQTQLEELEDHQTQLEYHQTQFGDPQTQFEDQQTQLEDPQTQFGDPQTQFDELERTSFPEKNKSGDKLNLVDLEDFGKLDDSTRSKRLTDRFDHRKNKVVKRGVDAVSRARRGVEAASRARRDVRCQPWAGADPFFQVMTSRGVFNLTSSYCQLCDGSNVTCDVPVSRYLVDTSVQLVIHSKNGTFAQCSARGAEQCIDNQVDIDVESPVCRSMDLTRGSKLTLRVSADSLGSQDVVDSICALNDSINYFMEINVKVYRDCANHSNI